MCIFHGASIKKENSRVRLLGGRIYGGGGGGDNNGGLPAGAGKINI